MKALAAHGHWNTPSLSPAVRTVRALVQAAMQGRLAWERIASSNCMGTMGLAAASDARSTCTTQ